MRRQAAVSPYAVSFAMQASPARCRIASAGVAGVSIQRRLSGAVARDESFHLVHQFSGQPDPRSRSGSAGTVRAQARVRVPQDLRPVTVEDPDEAAGLALRPLDEVRIAGSVLHRRLSAPDTYASSRSVSGKSSPMNSSGSFASRATA